MVVRQQLARWQVGALVAVVCSLGLTAQAANQAVETRMKKDITFLASDECEGRGVTTKGINLAADYIANEFKKAGLKPAGEAGTFFQPFTIKGVAQQGDVNSLVLQGPSGQEITLQLGRHFQPLGISRGGQVTAPLAFAGYGASVKDAGYDDYEDVDVAGKVVVVLRRVPRTDNKEAPFANGKGDAYAPLTTKMSNANLHKAAA